MLIINNIFLSVYDYNFLLVNGNHKKLNDNIIFWSDVQTLEKKFNPPKMLYENLRYTNNAPEITCIKGKTWMIKRKSDTKFNAAKSQNPDAKMKNVKWNILISYSYNTSELDLR